MGEESNHKLKEALVYEDHKYYFECPYCGDDETYESRDFAEMFDRETYQVQCRCGEVSIVNFCEGESRDFSFFYTDKEIEEAFGLKNVSELLEKMVEKNWINIDLLEGHPEIRVIWGVC